MEIPVEGVALSLIPYLDWQGFERGMERGGRGVTDPLQQAKEAHSRGKSCTWETLGKLIKEIERLQEDLAECRSKVAQMMVERKRSLTYEETDIDPGGKIE